MAANKENKHEKSFRAALKLCSNENQIVGKARSRKNFITINGRKLKLLMIELQLRQAGWIVTGSLQQLWEGWVGVLLTVALPSTSSSHVETFFCLNCDSVWRRDAMVWLQCGVAPGRPRCCHTVTEERIPCYSYIGHHCKLPTKKWFYRQAGVSVLSISSLGQRWCGQ